MVKYSGQDFETPCKYADFNGTS